MNAEQLIAAGPIGAGVILLIILFRLFVGASRKNREDETAMAVRSIAEATAERDYARQERDEAEQRLAERHRQCAAELAELRDFYEDLIDKNKKEMHAEWRTTRNFLYQRIAHLEKILYDQVLTPPPADLTGEEPTS